MVLRRAADAKLETAIGCHTFRATGITDYLTNGGKLKVAQRMAGHSNAKTTGLYGRRNDDISLSEVVLSSSASVYCSCSYSTNKRVCPDSHAALVGRYSRRDARYSSWLDVSSGTWGKGPRSSTRERAG